MLVIVLVAASFLAIVPSISMNARAAILYVGGTGPGNYTTIQAALGAANPGDTVYVYSGTYNESVGTGRSLSLIGEDRNNTVIVGGVQAMAEWVNISGFTITNGAWGIEFIEVGNGNISNNIIKDNIGGISLYRSTNITLVNNEMVNNGIFMMGYSPEHWTTHTIGTSNTVNGRPVYYWKNAVGGTVPAGAGEVILANSTGVTVENQNTSRATTGIELGFSSGNLIANNTVSDNVPVVTNNHLGGIHVVFSDNNTITGNRVTHNGANGIYVDFSNGTSIVNNTVSYNDPTGIRMYSANRTTLANNTVLSNNITGMYLWSISGSVVNNTVSDSPNGYGIFLYFAANLTVTHNTVSSNKGPGIVLWHTSAAVMNNTVAYNKDGLNLDSSNHNTIIGNRFTWNNGSGIFFDQWSNNNTVVNNILSNSFYGIRSRQCFDNAITANVIEAYRGYGFFFNYSWNYSVYHNDIVGVFNHSFDDGANSWDDGYPSAGNYWSDYNGSDNYSGPNQDMPGSDGIGDTPYDIPGGANRDEYPLMKPYNIHLLPLSAPVGLRAVAGDANVTLTWNAPNSDGGSPVVNYTVYRGIVPGGEAYLAKIADLKTYTDVGLINGRTYYYQVSAVNGLGEGPRSDEASATPMTVPAAPAGLTAVPGNGQISLAWSPPPFDGGSPVTNYAIYRGMVSGIETFLIEVGGASDYTDTGLNKGQMYFYQVTAKNAVGEGPRSAEVNASTFTTPTEPLNLDATAGDRTATLSWSPPVSDGGSPVIGYKIFRGTGSGGETYLEFVGNVSEYVDGNLTNGVTYYYEVAAVNVVGEGARSLEVNATPASPPPPIAAISCKQEAQVGERVELDGSGSVGNITEYRWVITDEQGNPMGTLLGKTVAYTFERAGRYMVTLTVTDGSTGLDSNSSREILVREGPNIPLLIAVAAATTIALAGAGTEVGRVALLTLLVAPGFKKKAKEDPDTRGMIRGYIIVHPGDTYTEVKRNLRLSNGSATWHLAKLEKEGLIRSRVEGTRRLYYPAGGLPPLEDGGELHEIQKRLLAAVKRHPGLAVGILAEQLKVTRQLALYHLKALSQKGFVSMERRGFRLKIYPATGGGSARPTLRTS